MATMPELVLVAVDERERPFAIECFERGDAEGFTCHAYSTGGTLDVVLDNWEALKRRGILEAAIVHGYIGCKHNNHTHGVRYIERMFCRCDLAKLRAVGLPLPSDGPFRIYRGVSGKRPNRNVLGLSWTPQLDSACWFALRYAAALGDPTVYTASIRAGDVWCYTDDRHEQEFIGRPLSCRRLKISLAEMNERRDRWIEQKRKADSTADAADENEG